MLIFGAITAALAFAGFIIGLPWGVEGVAFGYFVANALLIPPGLALSLPLIGLRVATLLKRLALPLLAALLMAGAVLGARAAISDVDPYVRFAALVGVGVVSYAGAAFLFCRRELYDLLKVAKGGKELSDNRGDQ